MGDPTRRTTDASDGPHTDDTADDTFTPPTVPDRIERRARDDHAPNAALHDALSATDAFDSVTLMASHAPSERDDKGRERYHVTVSIHSDGHGPADFAGTPLAGMIDNNDVRVVDLFASTDDSDPDGPAVTKLTAYVRPVETTVEPVDVPVDDVPLDRLGLADLVDDDPAPDAGFDGTTVPHPGGEPEVWTHDPIRNPAHARRVAEAILDTHAKTGITDHGDTVDLTLDVWGEPRQLATLSEEANELSRAIVRYLNHRPKAGMNDIVEEAADVWVGIEHVRQIIGDDRFDDAAADAFQSLRAKAAAAEADDPAPDDHDFAAGDDDAFQSLRDKVDAAADGITTDDFTADDGGGE